METRIYRSKSHAIFASAEELRSLVLFLRKHYSTLEFEAECSDGSRLKAEQLEELLEFENPSARRIDMFKIVFRGKSFEDSGDIELGETGSHTARWVVRTTDDVKATHVADELGRRVSELRPWHSLLRRLRPTLVLWAVFICYLIVSKWHQLLKTGRLSEAQFGFGTFVDVTYLMAPVLVIVLVAGIALEKVWDWFFPHVWFLTGRQVREWNRRTTVRRYTFVVVGLGIVLGVLSNVAYSLISQ